MRRYSPSALGTFVKNCPAALGFYFQRRTEKPDYRVGSNPFAEFGQAFHYMVYKAALAVKAGNDKNKELEAASIGLMTTMPPAVVDEATEHAREFIAFWEFPKQFDYEYGMAFDDKWKRVEYESLVAKFRLIMDAVGTMNFQDGEYEYLLACGQDYKTGWGCSKEELDSVQMDAYVTVLDELYKDKVDGIVIEIVSSRLHRAFSKMLFYNNPEHVEEIQRRRERLQNFIKAADLSDLSPRVGYGCTNCDAAMRCDAFKDALTKSLAGVFPPTNEGMKEAAIAYVTLKKRFSYAETALKEYCKEHGPVELDGNVLGYFDKQTRELKDPRDILEVWFKATKYEPDKELATSLATLFGILSPGVTAWQNVVKKCSKPLGFPSQKKAIEEFGEKHLEYRTGSQFKWKKEEEIEDE